MDLNPGTCLWSKTVHERLKPRQHILLEPDDQLYGPFLQPLLDAPDSKYKHVKRSGIVWAHLQTVLLPQHLPDQPILSPGDVRLEAKNNTLLVLVNLGFWPMKPYEGFDSMASLVLYQFMNACRTRSLFQRYGRVRFLVWTNEAEKIAILPRDPLLRRKASVEMEIAFEEINEVASTTTVERYGWRKFEEEKMIGQQVIEKMSSNGLSTPVGRESILMQRMNGALPVAEARPWSVSEARVEDIAQLQEKFDRGEIQQYADTGSKRTTPEYKEFQRKVLLRNVASRRHEKGQVIVRKHVQLMKSYKDMIDRRKAGEDVTDVERSLNEEFEQWYLDWENQTEDMQVHTTVLLDDLRALSGDVPLLTYDRRNYEPLLIRGEEFYPSRPMCLLDFHPAANWPLLQGVPEAASNRDVLEYILGSFYNLPTQSVSKALKSLWPGASEWIVERCPSLTDPRKGGARDLDSLTVRTVSRDMYKEILEAWSTWPFRPSRYEIISKMGGLAYDPSTATI